MDFDLAHKHKKEADSFAGLGDCMIPFKSVGPHFTGDGHTKPILTEVKDQALLGLWTCRAQFVSNHSSPAVGMFVRCEAKIDHTEKG